MDRSGGPPPRAGSYRLLDRIGEGGMGVVHLAVTTDGRLVAVKLLRPHVVGGAEARARMARELESLSRVRGPGVAEVVDADVTADPPYLVTRYVPGMSLDAVVAAHGPLRLPAAVSMAAGLADALSAVHDAGVVHRDVKPSNVMINSGLVVLIDFGVARAAGDAPLTAAGFVMGTPAYMAPETVLGQPSTPATDVHGWAATVTFAATGRAPYGSGHDWAVLDRIRRGEAELHAVPSELLPLVRGGLAWNPQARPSIGQVREALLALRAHVGEALITVSEGAFGSHDDRTGQPSSSGSRTDGRVDPGTLRHDQMAAGVRLAGQAQPHSPVPPPAWGAAAAAAPSGQPRRPDPNGAAPGLEPTAPGLEPTAPAVAVTRPATAVSSKGSAPAVSATQQPPPPRPPHVEPSPRSPHVEPAPPLPHVEPSPRGSGVRGPSPQEATTSLWARRNPTRLEPVARAVADPWRVSPAPGGRDPVAGDTWLTAGAPPSRRTHLVPLGTGALLVVAAASALSPFVALGGLVLLMALMQTIWRVHSARVRRHMLFGRRRGDVMRAFGHAPLALFASALRAVAQGVFVASVGILVASAVGTAGVHQRLVLLAGGAAAGLTAWRGPGALPIRRATWMMFGGRSSRTVRVLGGLFVLVAIALLMIEESYGTRWWPLAPPL